MYCFIYKYIGIKLWISYSSKCKCYSRQKARNISGPLSSISVIFLCV